MPIAAVPAYLGHDFEDASPGMRFGMYLSLWGINRRTQAILWTTHDIAYEEHGKNKEEREVKKENKVSALDNAKCLKRYLDTMRALLQRQQQTFDVSVTDADGLRIEALATAPFTTGLGNAHQLENGFAFLNPYGLPYLPGSGVKGVLRQAARELATGDWGEAHGWSAEKSFAVVAGKERIALSALDALFGLESATGETQSVRGALTFWDVIPQIKGDNLMVEMMTPHQSHYYQQKCDQKQGGSDTPHDSGQPNPISFLTVPPDSSFVFHVQCDLTHLSRIAPELVADGNWKTLLTAALKHAFQWLGFGAKTAVGYGAMKEDLKALERAEEKRQAQAETARQAALAQMSPIEREIQEFLDARQDKNQPEWSALLGGLEKGQWSGDSKVAVAKRAMAMLKDAKKWKEKSEKKNPEKDRDYQDTLKVMKWIKGQ